MRCTQQDAELQAWFDGELEPSQAQRVQQHVAACPACQRRLQLLETLRAALQARTAAHRAPADVHDRLRRRLREVEHRRRLWATTLVAMAAVALLSALASVSWWLPRQESAVLVTELTKAHAALVRNELALAYLSADAAAIQRWLGEHLPFQPFVPRVEAVDFRVLGARTLVLARQAAAVISLHRAGHLYSLMSFPDPGTIPEVGDMLELEGSQVRIVQQGGYTLVLWSVQGFMYAMVSDDDRDELLEYAALCVRQMRPRT
jgi:anti-sigma factor (TIGR02949 family)